MWFFWLLNLLILTNSQNYLGREKDYSGAVSEFSTCLSSKSCFIVTNNFGAKKETDDIILEKDNDYSILPISASESLGLILDISKVNVIGSCIFERLRVS
jgi:hypothetical protein